PRRTSALRRHPSPTQGFGAPNRGFAGIILGCTASATAAPPAPARPLCKGYMANQPGHPALRARRKPARAAHQMIAPQLAVPPAPARGGFVLFKTTGMAPTGGVRAAAE